MKILNYPHPVLRAKAEPISTISKELAIQAGEMLELMYKHEGLGLAGPQVGLPLQILVMNFSGKPEEKENECVAINPVIVNMQGAQVNDREGCLSFPGVFTNIRRYKTVRVQAYNLKGELFEMVSNDLGARLWQHEVDHLQGALFIDKMGPIGRMNTRKQIEEFIEAFAKDKQRGDLPPDLEPRL
ncbi:peptide deformylase [Telmatocola sphagniphila]|jgi:peptide deformylase|uniref:Peptide deformylase n=1 Tax=Telmatocola sphagniphila TaxID=1123043 RepID=A0A8E6ESP9_9BACT|nr:peptide deformylase [Telmatocola sphagniphila]QVL31114.1 peptide deformylase [Telmatocola sphagniphila]